MAKGDNKDKILCNQEKPAVFEAVPHPIPDDRAQWYPEIHALFGDERVYLIAKANRF